MKKIIKIILILAIFSTVQISSAKLILEDYDHKPVICFNGCHDNGGYNYGAESDNNCGNCHKYKLPEGGINVPLMEEEHNPNICKICHNVQDANSYHNLHENVNGSCTRCHGEKGQIPDKSWNECTGCHSGQVHAIHQDKISQVCANCHGIRPGTDPAGSASSNKEITAAIYSNVINYKQFTLFEVLKRILSSLSI